jgi:hypothetical protein
LRNYLYISDSKVDDYIGEMDETVRRTVVKQVGVKMAIFSASISSQTTRQPNRVSRLRVVERHLLDNASVGPLNSGKSWIEDSAPLVTATFGGKIRNLAFFFAPDGEHFLGLGGSASHVVGGIAPIEPVDTPYKPTHLDDMLQMLEIASDVQPSLVMRDKTQAALRHHLDAGRAKGPIRTGRQFCQAWPASSKTGHGRARGFLRGD